MMNRLHRELRLSWCESTLSWSAEWTHVIFSDEKRFRCDGPDGWGYFYHDIRKEKLSFGKRQNGGGGVMVWGAIGWNGKTDIVIMGENENSASYCNMLQIHLLPCMQEMAEPRMILQQDNAPIHSCLSGHHHRFP